VAVSPTLPIVCTMPLLFRFFFFGQHDFYVWNIVDTPIFPERKQAKSKTSRRLYGYTLIN